MFILLFLIWLVFNGRIGADVIATGLIVCGALYFFCCRFMGFSFKKDMTIVREIPLIILYIINLAIEIIKASLATIGCILSPGQPHSAIIKFQSGLKSNTARVLLANSITLTPGTISVDLQGDEYIIHCLDKRFGDGIDESSFVKQLRKMEEVAGL